MSLRCRLELHDPRLVGVLAAREVSVLRPDAVFNITICTYRCTRCGRLTQDRLDGHWTMDGLASGTDR